MKIIKTTNERTTKYPTPNRIASLNIEVSGKCNLKCAGCRRTTENIDINGRGKETMPLQKFKNIIKTLPDIDSIVFTGEGEPTINKHLPEMIYFLKKINKNTHTTLVTNLVSRNINYYKSLFKSGLDSIAVSIDSLQQDKADLLRNGTKTEKLKEKLKDLKGISKNPIRIFIAVGKENQMDVFETLDELNRIGNLQIMLAEYMNKGKPEWCQNNVEKKQFVKNILARAKEYNRIAISPPSFSFAAQGQCLRPFNSPAINVEGYLTPCCSSFNGEIYKQTNVTGTWQSIWEKEGVQEWLHDFTNNKGGAYEMCRVCILNPKRFLGLI